MKNPPPEATEEFKTLTDAAYHQLRHHIICGVLLPERKLTIDYLKGAYGFGATPLREALSRIAADGFVTSEGRRGFRVAPVSLEDLHDITDIRIKLEHHAIADSLENGDDAWEARVISAFHCLSKVESKIRTHFSEWEKRNEEFHNAIVSACSSRWLLRFRTDIYNQHKRYRCISAYSNKPKVRDVSQEHTQIKEEALARNIEGTNQATAEHIRNTMMIDEAELLAQYSESCGSRK